jgi:hypothetical protein
MHAGIQTIMNTRRLRGLFGVTLLGSLSWAAFGCLAGFAYQYYLSTLSQPVYVSLMMNGRPVSGGFPVVGVISGAIIGAINGLTFGGLLIATERGKKLEQIRLLRFAAVGGVATGATLGFVFQSFTAAGIGGVIGAIAGMGALWLARRAQ